MAKRTSWGKREDREGSASSHHLEEMDRQTHSGRQADQGPGLRRDQGRALSPGYLSSEEEFPGEEAGGGWLALERDRVYTGTGDTSSVRMVPRSPDHLLLRPLVLPPAQPRGLRPSLGF